MHARASRSATSSTLVRRTGAAASPLAVRHPNGEMRRNTEARSPPGCNRLVYCAWVGSLTLRDCGTTGFSDHRGREGDLLRFDQPLEVLVRELD